MAAKKKTSKRKPIVRPGRQTKGKKMSVEEIKALGLKPWTKGQSGNPKGGSRKQRRRVYLKELLNDALGLDLPADWFAQLNKLDLDGRLNAKLPEGANIGEAIAVRIITKALLGNEKAADQILGSEPKDINLDGELELQNATESEVANELATIAKRMRAGKRHR